MKMGASAGLIRRGGGVFPDAVSLTLTPSRRVYGGSGRGDLLYENPDARRHSGRALGVLNGVRHSSQATMPESGQLYHRKLILHSRPPNGSCAGLQRHCHDTCNWSYLIPSLHRCAESAISAKLWEKMCQLGLEDRSKAWVNLTQYERQRVRDGQNLYRYEVHQRLPLLEESIGWAQLDDLLGWFCSARRAWVRLPTSVTLSRESSEAGVASVVSPSSTMSCRLEGHADSRDTTPGRNQVFDTPERVEQLTEATVHRIREELQRLNRSERSDCEGSAAMRASARRLARDEELSRCVEEELGWHGVALQHRIPVPK
ncbi:uncharacterized protein TEOVI_000402800 [Trypanosoma equiperdum]|uniref:Uncharacterized protein n=1 Tax=Trypanosoma equiperdum TaxID=5694 RepID=A0A1G4IIX9_TRYEQ|nr:hypothetical protein, conserved [Trypanosoma equiperdum]